MFNKVIIYPYNLGSGSAKDLAEALKARRVRPNGNYRWYSSHLVINWGASTIPGWATAKAIPHILNRPQYVANASAKDQTFRLLKTANVPIPDFCLSKAEAEKMLAKPKFGKNAHMILCRTLTRANSGRGIVIAKTKDEIVAAPLYTRYTPKKQEFRVHTSPKFGIFDIQEKRKKKDVEKSEVPYIRNHDQGWVFCREDVHCPDAVKHAAEAAVQALNLDFGAVDIGYHPEYGACVYEVNTAPGLEGQTLTNYVGLFKQFFTKA